MGGQHGVEHGAAAAAGQVDIEQDHVGLARVDLRDRGGDVAGLPDHLYGRFDLGADSGAEQ